MSIRRLFAALLLFVLAQAFCIFAVADESAPTPMPYPEDGSIRYTLFSSDAEILRLKQRLLENGYYPSIVKESDIEGTMLEEITLDAVREACSVNNLPYSDHGITTTAWDAIMGGLIVPFPTYSVQSGATAAPTSAPAPTATAYPHIAWGDQIHTNEIIRIQALLDDLGYLSNYSPGIYSWELRDAIDLFCQVNQIAYDQSAAENNGITAIFQQMLFNEDKIWTPFATPEPIVPATPEPTAEPGKLDKMRTYFVSSTTIGGVSIPNIAL